jgi:hypothetical protein
MRPNFRATGEWKSSLSDVCQFSCFGEGGPMVEPFDIFRIEDNRKVTWVGAAVSLQAARNRLELMSTEKDRKFLILDQQTGARFYFPDRSDTRRNLHQ